MRKLSNVFWINFFAFMVRGQTSIEFNVTVDTTKMRIGEKINYTLQLKADSTAQDYFSRTSPFAPFEILEKVRLILSGQKSLPFLEEICLDSI